MIYEIIGWYGAVALICGYLLNSFGIVESNSLIYQLINITGSIGIALISYKKKTFQPMVLNLIWLLIGVLAILSL
ncbi:hypothetical protein IT409_02765 [Candidatus Falkowbacteria bacterium]|nr:hypothetical protein [Candidatus Falkowbacteria bacterium]